MKVIKAIKKPVEVEAVQWTGVNRSEVEQFCGWDNTLFYCHLAEGSSVIELKLEIITLEGNMKAEIGDYIIKGVKGEFYPCKEDVFKATYDILN